MQRAPPRVAQRAVLEYQRAVDLGIREVDGSAGDGATGDGHVVTAAHVPGMQPGQQTAAELNACERGLPQVGWGFESAAHEFEHVAEFEPAQIEDPSDVSVGDLYDGRRVRAPPPRPNTTFAARGCP